MKTFKEIGTENKNDKVTYHRYDLVYPIFLENKRNDELKILEIGLGNGKDDTGNSTSLFKEYFPNSYLYVMDKDYEFQTNDYTVIKGDQSNQNDLIKVSNIIKETDLIIDDGSHHPMHQFKTFCYLFENLLKPDGYYIIEDIECNYWDNKSSVYGYEIGYFNVIDFFKRQIDEVNSEFNHRKNPLKMSFITFAKNCIVIKKQSKEEEEINKRPYRFDNML